MMSEEELSDRAIAQIADMLIGYHKRSFNIRKSGLFNGFVRLPVVDELDRLRRMITADYGADEIMAMATSFHEIVSKNKIEIKKRATSAEELNDAREVAEEISGLMEELDAASWLLELLDARR